MDARTLKALKGSIAHWERLSRKRTVSGLVAEGAGAASCDLCGLFLENDCAGCPVRGKAGRTACYGTPYERASDMYCEAIDGEGSITDFRAAAKEELAFLRSLLPEEV